MAGRAAALLTAAVLVVAGCGPEEPRISSTEYLDRCETELTRQDRQDDFSVPDIEAICRCTQQKLVERGDGDRRIDDPALGDGAQLARECALEVLSRE